MKNKNSNTEAFFALLRAGLWETDIRLSDYEPIDFAAIQSLAEEQSVVGLIAAGLEHVVDKKPAKKDVLQFIGQTLQLEQQNYAMNEFIGVLIDKMRKVGIYTLLVKGQGVAQCYERPLWRCCGDIDLFLSDENYKKAKEFLIPLAFSVETERGPHLGMTIDSWIVELHGHFFCGISGRMDCVIKEVEDSVIYHGNVRTWMNGNTQVFLPGVDNDVIFIFTHFIKHFYKGGLGLRQICDWCRLLYTYRDSLNYGLLEQRIKSAGLMSEWKAFGALAIEYLGFPKDSMPLLDVRSKKEDVRWRKKADRIMEFILKSGNMGHKRGSWLMEHDSWLSRQYVVRKAFSMFRRMGDLINHARIFPMDSLRFFPRIMWNGVRSAMRGE